MDFAMEPDYNHGNELTERDIWIDDIWKVLRELPRNAQVSIAMDSLDKLAKEQSAQQARKEAAIRAVNAYVKDCEGCSPILAEDCDERCPYIARLRAAILGEGK